MSFQAVTWAIEQKTGSPSGKAVLLSIANYANEQGVAWPSQKTLADESEQSADSVQRRANDLEKLSLIRRIPLRFAGRKTVDFCILGMSPLFDAPIDKIEPLLPRGCTIDPDHVAAECGSADTPNDTANCGHTLPQTLPQSAADVAAMVRQQEPAMEPKNQESERENARAKEKADRGLAEFKKRWPTIAHDDIAKTDQAWEALPDHEQEAALANIDPFLEDARRNKRAAIIAGWRYLEERRWHLLPQTHQEQPPSAFLTFKTWSREWWAVLLARVDRGESVAFFVDQAVQRGTHDCGERFDRMPSPDVVSALRQQPSDGEVFARWRPWFEGRGVKLPAWRERVWVFLPGPEPPAGDEAALSLVKPKAA